MIKLDSNFLEQLEIVDWGYTSSLEPVSYEQYQQWVDQNNHGVLSYLADDRKELRASLKNIEEDCQSALIFLFSYKETSFSYQEKWEDHRMASYALAYGERDYHYVIKERLDLIIEKLKLEYPSESFRSGIDTWPILERDLAYRAGLGWFGKNSMLINKKEGSLFLIGSILTSLKLEVNNALETDHCGHCRDCVDACPTDAIDPNTRTLIADKCISTFSIELFKDADAPSGIEKSNGEIFGCDICQDVCPWNIKLAKKSTPKSPEDNKLFNFFFSRPLGKVYEELMSWSNKKYTKEFKGTVVERTGRKGMLKNLKAYLKL